MVGLAHGRLLHPRTAPEQENLTAAVEAAAAAYTAVAGVAPSGHTREAAVAAVQATTQVARRRTAQVPPLVGPDTVCMTVVLAGVEHPGLGRAPHQLREKTVW